MIAGVVIIISAIAILFWMKKIYILNLNMLSTLKKINAKIIEKSISNSIFYTEQSDSSYSIETSEYTEDFTMPIIRQDIELKPIEDDDSYTE